MISKALAPKPPITASAIGKIPSGAYSAKSFMNNEFIDYSRPSTSSMVQPTMMALVKSSNLEPAMANQWPIEQR